ncbi:putative linocin/CFP29 family protein [Bradyrhizobium elkanii]
MNNLHRGLAPISDAAWAQIEEEASRTLKRHLAARRVVDVDGPKGTDFSAVGTGHLKKIAAPGDGVEATQRDVRALVELRVPFELSRQAIDDVERGANDSDWDPLKEAARKIAFAEDRAVFDGYAVAGIQGIRQGTSNPVLTLPSSVKNYPAVVAQAVSQLRLAGVNGPYTLLLGTEPYTAIGGATDDGYPVLQHIQRLIDGKIIWAPAIEGGVLLTTRGGDFQLSIGQDLSIGYLSHSAKSVQLYFQETITFLMLTSEASVVLAPEAKKTRLALSAFTLPGGFGQSVPERPSNCNGEEARNGLRSLHQSEEDIGRSLCPQGRGSSRSCRCQGLGVRRHLGAGQSAAAAREGNRGQRPRLSRHELISAGATSRRPSPGRSRASGSWPRCRPRPRAEDTRTAPADLRSRAAAT